MNILIIEESELLMQIIFQSVATLKTSTINSVKNFDEVNERLKNNKYDIIILNSKITANENNELIKFIRDKDKAVYIILVSTETNLNSIRAFYELEIDYFVPIPFDPYIFNLLIQRIYERINQFSCILKERNE